MSDVTIQPTVSTVEVTLDSSMDVTQVNFLSAPQVTISVNGHVDITGKENVGVAAALVEEAVLGTFDAASKENTGVAQSLLNNHTAAHPIPTSRDTRNEIAGTAISLLLGHTTPHPAPTVRDSRNQIAGLYEPARGPNSNYVTNDQIADWDQKQDRINAFDHTLTTYTAVVNDFLNVNATAGAKTVNPPESPEAGDEFWVRKSDASTNQVVVTGLGEIAYQGTTIHFIYTGTGWVAS